MAYNEGMDMTTEWLDILEDYMENGGDVPSKVTNRMLLVAMRQNKKGIANNLRVVKEEFGKTNHRVDILEKAEVANNIARKHQKEHCDRLRKAERFIAIGTVVLVVLAVIISYHTGVDLGWLPIP